MRNVVLIMTMATVFIGLAQANPAKPNILFIMADDHATQAIGTVTLTGPISGSKTVLDFNQISRREVKGR